MLTGQKVSMETILMMGILDTLRAIEYMYAKRNFKGSFTKPRSMLSMLTENDPESGELKTFDSYEEFEAERQKIIRGNSNG